MKLTRTQRTLQTKRLARRFWVLQADAARRTDLRTFYRHTSRQTFAAGYTLDAKRGQVRELLRARCSNY